METLFYKIQLHIKTTFLYIISTKYRNVHLKLKIIMETIQIKNGLPRDRWNYNHLYMKDES